MAPRLALALVAMACLGGCSRASDQGSAKQWQHDPPPGELTVPAGLSIAVTVDGAARPPITSAALSSVKPDFSDADHRAWLIATLVADAAPAGTVIEAASPTGVSVKLSHPMADGLEPVVALTRRGEVMFEALAPKDPFPRYHGQGGRVHRAGDPMPHVVGVSQLAITRPGRPAGSAASTP